MAGRSHNRNIRPKATPLPVVDFKTAERHEKCPECGGAGEISTDCSVCFGEGYVANGDPCGECSGTGIDWAPCDFCGGTGTGQEEKEALG